MHIKDKIDDVDQPDGYIFNEWYAKMCFCRNAYRLGGICMIRQDIYVKQWDWTIHAFFCGYRVLGR